MIYYTYDPNTGELRESHDGAVLPVNATTVPPPPAPRDSKAVFVGGVWQVLPDFRGQLWYDQISGTPAIITQLGTPPANLGPSLPTAAALAAAQTAKLASLAQSYVLAIAAGVQFTTAGGVTQTFQTDKASIDNILYALNGYAKAGATPSGFYWLASDNTQVLFTYADVQGLAEAAMAAGWPAFQHLQSLKVQVRAATTIAAVGAITW